ncbi:hypothetical protein BRADI_2g22594v3 [Brachypodium distachyon]|uniref:Uncharacterized protein n=1 Tax=Brachypodium distachyon TaxID=15368 RepID=A0A0Q3IZK5_BRADI|nr:hypothetical protein BRADI_2g22594v3 [Brachypodium distachyon]
MAREDYYLGRLPDSPAMPQSSLRPTVIATTVWVFLSLSIPSSCLPDMCWRGALPLLPLLDPTAVALAAPTGRPPPAGSSTVARCAH